MRHDRSHCRSDEDHNYYDDSHILAFTILNQATRRILSFVKVAEKSSLRRSIWIKTHLENMSKTILIVDDDVELCSLMKDFFAQQGFRTECAHDGQAGLVRSLEGGFDLLILDAMLPVLDGFELLRLLRKQSAIPVIMLTARTAQHDRIKGLDAGADDHAAYIFIRDYGPGVPQDSLNKIFEPFFRVDDSRNRSTGGVGLGLAIAHRSIISHDGRIWAENANPGLVVRIELPSLAHRGAVART